MTKRTEKSKPPKFDRKHIETARKLCEIFGATPEELAAVFDVDVTTLDTWIAAHPDLEDAIRKGSVMADAAIAERLHRRAVGYTRRVRKAFFAEGATEPVYVDVEEHHPPDVEACKFWLGNRQPEHWREVLVRGEVTVIN